MKNTARFSKMILGIAVIAFVLSMSSCQRDFYQKGSSKEMKQLRNPRVL